MFSINRVNFKNAVRFGSYLIDCFKKHRVIPDVIDCGSNEVARVIYPCETVVDLGNVLTPTLVKDLPYITWNADYSAYYTLILTDPDAPSRKEPKYREWHHWLVGNISGCDVCNGETLSDYIGAGPPKDTGLHRYIFLIFQQKGMHCFDEPRLTNTSALHRELFSTRKFAAKYCLGSPIAVNFFQAQYDDYVPILYKQLGA